MKLVLTLNSFLYEYAAEDDGERVVRSQKRDRYAVETDGGQGLICRPVELSVAREIIQRRGAAGESPGYGHGYDDIAFIVDARVFRCVAV